MKKIYIILNESTGRFKIGFSNKPEKRLKTLQTGNDDILKLYYQREVKYHSKVEASLKRHYAAYQTVGEWFDYEINFWEFDDLVKKTDVMFESLRDNPFIKF